MSSYPPQQLDPCSPDGVTTLFHIVPCGPSNPTMQVFCSDPANVATAAQLYVDTDVCASYYSTGDTTATTVAVVAGGQPPALPSTGAASGTIAVSGSILIVLGVLLTRSRPRPARG